MPRDPRPSRQSPAPLRAPRYLAASSPQIDGGAPLDEGTLALTTANDTSAGAGGVGPGGTLAKTTANDTIVAAGGVGPKGTLAKTSTGDTSTASGGVGPSGTLAKTSTVDTSAGTGGVGSAGTLARTAAADTSVGTGRVYAIVVSDTCQIQDEAGNPILDEAGHQLLIESCAETTTTQPTGAGGKWDVTRASRDAWRKRMEGESMLAREDEELLCLL